MVGEDEDDIFRSDSPEALAAKRTRQVDTSPILFRSQRRRSSLPGGGLEPAALHPSNQPPSSSTHSSPRQLSIDQPSIPAALQTAASNNTDVHTPQAVSVIQNGASISNLLGPEAADSEAQSTGSVAGRQNGASNGTESENGASNVPEPDNGASNVIESENVIESTASNIDAEALISLRNVLRESIAEVFEETINQRSSTSSIGEPQRSSSSSTGEPQSSSYINPAESQISDRINPSEVAQIDLPATTISPYFQPPNPLPQRRDLNGSTADFQTDDDIPDLQEKSNAGKEKKKKGKGKKRKATESVEEESDEGSCCTICFEPWSNSGDHRIASLRCGHFFGYICIEKWLKGTGSSCPNCNEKSTKKDIRVHYVSRLKALDTSEKDRALADLEKEKTGNRQIQLRLTEFEVRNGLLKEEIEKLQRELHQYRKFRGDLPTALQSSQPSLIPGTPTRLVYQKRYELLRPGNDKTCRVLAYSEYLGMLVISQPSFTALAPGYGVRQFNVMDQKVGSFISLCKDQVRDLSFSTISQHLMLSCGQDRSAKITNMSSGNKIAEFATEHQIWACDWSASNDYHVYLGTQKGCILIHDIRSPGSAPTILTFPDGDKKPIIGIKSVPARPEAGFHKPGFLVINLASLWFWIQESDDTWSYHKLNIEQRLLWSLDFERDSFLVLVGCKPSPLASHLVLELHSTQLTTGRTYTVRTVMTGKGGSFSQRSFLRSSLLPSPNGQVYVAFSKGSGQTDHKVVIQEVGSDRVTQELKVDKPVVDIQQLQINSDRYLALLGETDLIMYKWNPVN